MGPQNYSIGKEKLAMNATVIGLGPKFNLNVEVTNNGTDLVSEMKLASF